MESSNKNKNTHGHTRGLVLLAAMLLVSCGGGGGGGETAPSAPMVESGAPRLIDFYLTDPVAPIRLDHVAINTPALWVFVFEDDEMDVTCAVIICSHETEDYHVCITAVLADQEDVETIDKCPLVPSQAGMIPGWYAVEAYLIDCEMNESETLYYSFEVVR